SPMTIGDFISYMEKEITQGRDYNIYTYSRKDLDAISELRENRYSRDSWNYGSAPAYSFSKVRYFPAGLIELWMEVKRGKISDIKIFGSYFFLKETSELETLLKGAEHTPAGIGERLKKINLSDYFVNIAGEEFLSLFWD
ncbi:MAG: lipoate protein ligase C-terminal domain-containing protein, partial [Bacteroidales bacterium]|nr:lipoate protein ligase C-terminal domain-containing protein [Bacteroidales bacterium]